MQRFATLLAGATLIILQGCASLPTTPVRVHSDALPGTSTPLAETAAHSVDPEPQSGFRLIPDGGLALDARLALIQRATSSVDIQYYLIADDTSGRAVFRALADAATRGVRIRLLLDDLYTEDEPLLLQGLSAYPNTEIRLFNPFAGWRRSLSTRILSSLGDIGRINHRMHNKLMVVDGAFAVAGGRNIADGYFNRSKAENLVDNDVLVAGPLVDQLADVFDSYWNSNYVYPLDSIDHSDDSTAVRRAAFDAAIAQNGKVDGESPDFRDILGYGPIGPELDRGKLAMTPGLGFDFADLPSKITQANKSDLLDSASFDVVSVMHTANSEIVISSPYFIPGKRGMALLQDGRTHDVSINVLTNSLASNDTLLAHIGYARYRRQILKAGVDLYELSGAPFSRVREFGRFSLSKGGLHAKEAVMDRHTVFLGSLNFDPRSRIENTELGLIIESPALAGQLLRLIHLAETESAYRVTLAPNGLTLRWTRHDVAADQDVPDEPESSFLERMEIRLFGPFVSEDLL